MNIKILGTSHIAQESINEIKKNLDEENFDLVAVELDLQRAAALMSNQKNKLSLFDISKIGLRGFLFAKIGQFVQQKLGRMVGVNPGSEMKTALELAKKKRLKVAFIDQPIQITLKKFSKNLTWREKFRFLADIFRGLFFRKREMQKLGLDKLDLKKVPTSKLISKMMGHLKKRYPNIYKTLVVDRNKYMVKQLVRILREDSKRKILVIVGAGHKEGMEKLLLRVDVVG